MGTVTISYGGLQPVTAAHGFAELVRGTLLAFTQGVQQRRRFPRLSVRLPATLHARPVGAKHSVKAADRAPIEIPVMVTSLSPKGLAVEATATDAWYGPSKLAKIEFDIDGRALLLPLNLVRLQNTPETRIVGAQIVLEMTDGSTRRHYAKWIVGELSSQQPVEEPRSHHSSATVSASALRLARRLRTGS